MSELSAEFEGCIGVMDSGVGGISVLRQLVKLMPSENFVFYGDSANAPYGDKTPEQIYELAHRIVAGLIERGCKAVVIACNTATSVAAQRLRSEYSQLPIIGMEPALKPAVLDPNCHSVLVMATQRTLDLDKFQRLMHEYELQISVACAPCVGLADRIEQGNLDAPDLIQLLQRLVGKYAGQVDGVVLGCTHYPFVKQQIAQVLGDINFYDGSFGTAQHLMHKLQELGQLTQQGQGSVRFFSSVNSAEELFLYQRFYELSL